MLRLNCPISLQYFRLARDSLMVIAMLLTGCNGGSDVSITSQSDTTFSEDNPNSIPGNHQQASINYSTVADDIWPPQPQGVTNIQSYAGNTSSGSDRDVKIANTASTTLTLAMQSPNVLNLLGNRYEVTGQYSSNGKNGQIESTEIELFSYSKHRVVRVSIDANNHLRTTHRSTTAYQPAETQNEVRRAVALAADQLFMQGYPTEHLVGSGLLAHPTAEEINRDGRTFYQHRVIYVTFGRGEGTTPLFRAKVNLTTETVTEAGPL